MLVRSVRTLVSFVFVTMGKVDERRKEIQGPPRDYIFRIRGCQMFCGRETSLTEFILAS